GRAQGGVRGVGEGEGDGLVGLAGLVVGEGDGEALEAVALVEGQRAAGRRVVGAGGGGAVAGGVLDGDGLGRGLAEQRLDGGVTGVLLHRGKAEGNRAITAGTVPATFSSPPRRPGSESAIGNIRKSRTLTGSARGRPQGAPYRGHSAYDNASFLLK